MANPFDDESATFLVLVNDERQYSLWPAGAAVPAGWRVALAESSHDACVRFVEATWTDMRPAGLAAVMDARA
ncbi:MbtH family protein [Actinacidiphila sp. ITFR-21]|uniref:MbtH family protein n=1 Tax=Actinacidiphila sp. ITFR-21 TaxID=3075199 RepID=UPI00288AD683|nr:MbtH family protein [Streptomyces sp. ITFR-21]WNI16132.1 MbtH family protein [Streptomyces sp. ITFR-21]